MDNKTANSAARGARSGRRTRATCLLLAALVALAAVVGGVYGLRRASEKRALELLLRACARQSPVIAEAVIRTKLATGWAERKARIEQRAGRRRTEFVEAGQRVVLLDDGQRRWRLEEKRHLATLLGPSQRLADSALFAKNYAVQTQGRETVAGHEALRLAVRCRRTGRIAFRVWVEPTRAVILRYDTFDAEGELAAQTVLVSADLTATPDEQRLSLPPDYRIVKPEQTTGTQMTPARFSSQADFSPRPPEELPRGYVWQGLYAYRCPHGRLYAEFRYTDGLRVLSVFERHPRGGGRGRGPAPTGERGRWGRAWRDRPGPPSSSAPVLIDSGLTKSLRQRRGDLVVVVTGDLSLRELVRVLLSVPEN